jgi:hypothetical protein
MSSAQLLVALCVVLILVIVFYLVTSKRKERLTSPDAASIFVPTAVDMMQLPVGYPKMPNIYYLKNPVPVGKHLPPNYHAFINHLPGSNLSMHLSNRLNALNQAIASYKSDIAKAVETKNPMYINMIKRGYSSQNVIGTACIFISYILEAKIVGYGYPSGSFYYNGRSFNYATPAIFPGIHISSNGAPTAADKIWSLAGGQGRGVDGMTKTINNVGIGSQFNNNNMQNMLGQLINLIETTPLSAIPEAAAVYTESEYQDLLASFMPYLKQCWSVLNTYGPLWDGPTQLT